MGNAIATGELKALLAGATKGPWKAIAAGQANDFNEVIAYPDGSAGSFTSVADAEGDNARLIAADLLLEALALPEIAALVEAVQRERQLRAEWNDKTLHGDNDEQLYDRVDQANIDVMDALRNLTGEA